MRYMKKIGVFLHILLVYLGESLYNCDNWCRPKDHTVLRRERNELHSKRYS